ADGGGDGCPAGEGRRAHPGRAPVGQPGLRPEDPRLDGNRGGADQHGERGAAAARGAGGLSYCRSISITPWLLRLGWPILNISKPPTKRSPGAAKMPSMLPVTQLLQLTLPLM